MATLDTKFILHLADNALLLGHRNSEWTGHGPILEQDIAISNIALDLVGQARYFYQYAASEINLRHPARLETEDTLAYLRDARDFYNFLMVELPKGDWAVTTLRQFFFSCWQKLVLVKICADSDPQLSAIAQKSLKEINYHLQWSAEWIIRLGDGTDESRERLLAALDLLWTYTGEFFKGSAFYPPVLIMEEISEAWHSLVDSVFTEACLQQEFNNVLSKTRWMHSGGCDGLHTEHLGYLLAEMQFLQRAYPGCTW